MKILCLDEYIEDLENIVVGGILSRQYHLRAISRFAEVILPTEVETQFTESIRGIPFRKIDLASGKTNYNLEIIEREKIDGILIHGFQDRNIFNPSYRALKQLAPTIHRIHAIRWIGEYIDNHLLTEYHLMNVWDYLCPVSEWAKKVILKYVLASDCLHVIPNGVNIDFFQPIEKDRAKREVARILQRSDWLDKKVVGFLSRFELEKGAGIFIELAKRHPEFCFLAVGNTSQSFTSKAPSNLIFANFREKKMLPLFYNAFDIYCFPSMIGAESFGMTVLEAMVCGIPCVVTDFDGPPEVIGKTGLVISAERLERDICFFNAFPNIQLFSDAICKLLEDENLRLELGQAARKRSEKFSWDRVGKELIELFRKMREQKEKATMSKVTFPIKFYRQYYSDICEATSKAKLINDSDETERILNYDAYDISLEEGLTIELLKNHTYGEVEAVLLHVTKDADKTCRLIERVKNLLEKTTHFKIEKKLLSPQK